MRIKHRQWRQSLLRYSKVLSVMSSNIVIVTADLSQPAHATAWLAMLDAYASDPAGGGEGLSPFAKRHLIESIQARPAIYSVLAFDNDKAVGLVNAIEGFSTFACKPLVNIHDVAVIADYRGQGIAGMMLRHAEAIARRRGACKLTLEVLSGNAPAITAYQRLGFEAYQLDPQLGDARFMQRWLD